MKNKLRIFCVFLFCAIIVFSVVFTYSKYKKGVKLKIFTKIAEPIFDVVYADLNTIDFLNNDKYSYKFKIRNYKENKISKIDFEYNINLLISQENAPIIFKLYRIEGGNRIELELENYELIKLEKFEKEKEENEYILEIMYDKDSKEILENNFEVKLKIEAIQQEEVII